MGEIIGFSTRERFDDEPTPVVYRIDEADRICFINPGWRVFAAENDDRHAPEHYLGRRIWDFMDTSDGAVLLHQFLAREVRTSGRAVFVRFPCDTPDMERDMEMSIMKAGNDNLIYCTRQLEIRERVPVPEPETKPFYLCRSCAKLETPAGWFGVFELITRALITMDRAPMRIEETTCPDCR